MTTSPAPEPAEARNLLSTAGQALAHGADVDATIGAILDATVTAVAAKRAAIFLQDPDRATLQLSGAIGYADDAVEALAMAVADPDHPVVVAARDRSTRFGRAGGAGDATVAADLPLVVSRAGIDLPMGVLTLEWPADHQINDDETTTVTAAADLLAVAIDHARLASMVAERAEWFERLAHTDPLTGLANMRTFNRVLELELARAGRQGSEVSVALFDIDDFAAINDALGRDAGDDLLRSIAAVLGESIRLVDTVARSGGDEFIVVAPGAAGSTVARRVIEGVSAMPVIDGRTASVSAGVARFPTDGASADELVTAARAALDRARQDGPGHQAAAGVEGAV